MKNDLGKKRGLFMDQGKTPLYTALKRHDAIHPFSFHVPGHKYGFVFPANARNDYEPLLKLDATELTGLDDLHHPESVIAEAQLLAAKLYNVEETFFLVNGSTTGNLAMIFAVCGEKKKVIVQRNCHKSVMHALQLAGATPVFLSPEFDKDVRVASYVAYDTIKKALELHPDAAALVLTNPNYYGMAVDLTEVVHLAHRYGIPVLVDEAHGAHFILGQPFPKTAVACGADVVVQSAHKTLPAMTMGSYLHFNSSLVDKEKLKYFLQVFQSSSPSYPIMASLDLARSYVACLTKNDVKKVAEQIREFKDALATIEGIAIVHSHQPLVQTDLLKITLQTRSELSGYELQQLLEREGIFAELADPFNVLLIYPLAVIEQMEQVVEKIQQAFRGLRYSEQLLYSFHSFSFLPSTDAISYKELQTLPKKVVDLKRAEGYIAAETIIPYPPGVPLLWIGERICKEHIEQIEQLKRCHARFQGGRYLSTQQIEVYDLIK
jgi:arginine/lysine/ornithine decarboxylase